MTKSQLIEKVYRCIDEAYPNTDEASPDVEEFNIPALLEEAIRWVAKNVPSSALGSGTPCKTLDVPSNFLRLIKFKMEGWNTSVTDALSETNPKYWQQQNPALRGGNSRPVVFLVDGETKLEPYPYYEKNEEIEGENGTENVKTPAIATFQYFAMPNMDPDFTYPDKLIDITAWKTAELIFSVMQDANGVSIAQAQITSILPTL